MPVVSPPSNIAVSPAFKGQGHGRQLLDFAERYA
ncbi:MAG: GNAT family N-acetyltransferase [Pseudomonas fluorescens]